MDLPPKKLWVNDDKKLVFWVNYPFKASTTQFYRFTDKTEKHEDNKLVKIFIAHFFYRFERLIKRDTDTNAYI